LAVDFEASTQWPVSLKQTGSDLLVASARAELELELDALLAGAADEALAGGGAEEGAGGAVAASWP